MNKDEVPEKSIKLKDLKEQLDRSQKLHAQTHESLLMIRGQILTLQEMIQNLEKEENDGEATTPPADDVPSEADN